MSNKQPTGFRIRSIAYIFAVIITTVIVVNYFALAATTTIGNNISTSGTLTVGGASLLSGAVNASSTLQTTGNVRFYGNLTVDGTTNIAGLSFSTATITGTLYVGNDISSTGGDFNLGTGGATSTLSSSGGKLGIGSTSPWGFFSVEMGTDNPSFVVSNNGSSTPSLFVGGVNQNGRVGIGTTTPDQALTVAGNISNNPLNPTLVTTHSVNNPSAVYVSGRLAYISSDATMRIYDVSSSTPALIGIYTPGLGTSISTIQVVGRYAYLSTLHTSTAANNTFRIVDVSNPASPTEVGSVTFNTIQGAFSIFVSGQNAYVTVDNTNRLAVIDISNPFNPRITSQSATGNRPRSVYVSGKYAYVASSHADTGTASSFEIFDISTSTPARVSSTATNGIMLNSVYVSGEHAYFTTQNDADQLRIYNVANPASPILAGTIAMLGSNNQDNSYTIHVSGRYAYVLNGSGIEIFDVFTPTAPARVGSISRTINPRAALFVAGRYIYAVTGSTNTFEIFDISGLETGSAMIHSLEAGNLQVRNDIFANGQLLVGTALGVGIGGINSNGPLVAYGTSTFHRALIASSTLGVTGDSTFYSPLFANAALNASSTLGVTGNSIFYGTLGVGTTTPGAAFAVQGNALLSGDLSLANLIATGTLNITGVTTLVNASTTGMLTIGTGFISSASSTVSNSLQVSGQLYASSTLSVASLASLNGGLLASGASSTVSGILNVNGTLSASSTLTVASLASLNGAFVSVGSSTVTNSLQVSGQLYASSTLSVASLASLNGAFISVGSSTIAGSLQVAAPLSASSTLSVAGLAKLDTGFITNGSSTVIGAFNITGALRSSSTATSTFANGIKLTGGCFQLADNTCAGSGGGLTIGGAVSGGTASRVLYEDSSNLLAESANLTFNGTNLTVLTASTTGQHTFGSFISSASSTIASSLNISGQLYASSTLSVAGLASLNTGFIANTASSTVSGMLSINGALNASTTLNVGGLASLSGFISTASSTLSSGNFIISGSTGSLGIGSSTPYARLAVRASAGSATRLVSVASSSDDIYFEISSTGTTTIDQLQTGVMTFEANAGAITWVDMPVTSFAATNTIVSYSAMIDASTTLTIYGESNGSGSVIRQKVGIGTSTPWGILSVERTDATTSPMFVVSSMSTGTAYFIVASNGNVGIGTSSPGFPLSVFGNIGVMSCIKGATTSQSTIFGPGDCVVQDIAESYLAGEILEPGDVVALDENNPIRLIKATKASKLILGAISTQPAVLFEGSVSSFGAPDTQSSYAIGDKAPLALIGRIPVKVNLEGGAIKAGDPITASLEPGIGSKASTSGTIIGYALEDFSGPTEQNQSKVSIFISLGNWQAPISESAEAGDSLFAQVIDMVRSWLESLQVYIENGIVRLKELVAEKITSKKGVFDRVELKDESGQTYCVQIQSGSLISVAGECPEPISEPEPSVPEEGQ